MHSAEAAGSRHFCLERRFTAKRRNGEHGVLDHAELFWAGLAPAADADCQKEKKQRDRSSESHGSVRG
jgi:hypothetical protein